MTTDIFELDHRFERECYMYMKNQDVSSKDIPFIFDYVKQHHITWIESMELERGMEISDGELLVHNLDHRHEYIIPLFGEKICFR
jgi:hypothetical protein